jgi:lysyl-tRNA synthetase class 2
MKGAELHRAGHDPYPAARRDLERVHDVVARFASVAEDSRTGQRVRVCGRVMRQHDAGGVRFAMLREGSTEIQLVLDRALTPAPQWSAWGTGVDVGDHVAAEGEVVATRRGTVSVQVASWTMATKALRPLPGRYRGAVEPASSGGRPRPRYQEMLLGNRPIERVRVRAAVLRALRAHLEQDEYVEVLTPFLHSCHGGAASRPFTTRMAAWDTDLHLRITAELYLKRLIVGGLERVFEVSPVFRNEGVDALHFPEFTVLEGCAVHADHHRMADLVEELVRVATEAAGRARADGGADPVPGAPGPPARRTMFDLLSEEFDAKLSPDTARRDLVELAQARGLAVKRTATAGEVAYLLHRKVVQPRLTAPTVVLNPPVEAAIFARSTPHDPRLSESWNLVVSGIEVAQGCSELTDPVEQRRRLAAQAQSGTAETGAAPRLDEEFLTALEHGLPPAGGFAVGIERLLMAVCGGGRIGEFQAHPIVRPRRSPAGGTGS